jgi:hypothetical protein
LTRFELPSCWYLEFEANLNDDDQRSVIEYTARLASLVAPNALKLSGKTIQFIGTEPFAVDELQGLLPSDVNVVVDEPVDNPDIVVLGVEDFEEEQISAAVDARYEGTSFLPQDGFLDLVLFGYDWWANHVNLLNRSKDSHPGMSYLHSLQSFRWPGTEALESDGTGDSSGEFQSETPLHRLGYQITGLSRARRWQVLTVAVPSLGLEEVAGTIASNLRLRRAQVGGANRYANAIGEWEHDLSRLQTTYYSGSRENFQWPSTGR